MSDKPLILIGMPYYGGVEPGSVLASSLYAAMSKDFDIALLKWEPSSALCHSFNRLWATALSSARKGSGTHFLMCHSDCVPQPEGVQILWNEMQRTQADYIAAVSPLKDHRGLTSTGIEVDRWTVRRLSLKEIHKLPETFCSDDVGGRLMVNTGFWLADLSNPFWWLTNHASELVFRFWTDNRILLRQDGELQIEFASEDWNFSRAMADHGMRYFATRKIALAHHGGMAWGNSCWGDWETDQEVVGG